jgi:hypothetical protein
MALLQRAYGEGNRRGAPENNLNGHASTMIVQGVLVPHDKGTRGLPDVSKFASPRGITDVNATRNLLNMRTGVYNPG